ncbi:MAG TPA: hypothetical protein VJG90_04150 [Candidatus Nanoarchaeia archaeon]|nr:hypothetical protein [Candidatus Nanoarchaeia archaeon]
MLKLELNNVLLAVNPPLQTVLHDIQYRPVPDFATYTPDFARIYEAATQYGNLEHFIIAGRGGSITGFQALWNALGRFSTTKNVHILNTTDPERILYLKNKCPLYTTLLIVISKSGNTVDLIEDFFSFSEYKKLIITEPNEGTLHQLAQKFNIPLINHPPIGGRFSANTECALCPASILYVPVDQIYAGSQHLYDQCHPNKTWQENPALQLALALYLLEQKGYSEIYVPLYGEELYGFQEYIVQLMHETVCKQGQGQTFYTAMAPEAEHHTNQRFLGGKKNVAGLFLKVDQHADAGVTRIPLDLRNIPLRNGFLSDLHDIPLTQTLEFEYQGTLRDATQHGIPTLTISLDKITPYTVGELLGFWQYVAVYSAWLRGVNPFDQPAVENAKTISFDLRKNYGRV